MTDIATAIAMLERIISADGADAASRYRLAVLLLYQAAKTYDQALLSQVRDHLAHAIGLRPRHARSHAALGYACDLSEGMAEQALASYREARRLNPQDKLCEVDFIKLLDDTGRGGEALVEIEAAALRHDVDLPGLRRQLTAAGMPTDIRTLLANGFAGYRLRSWLAAEAERIVNALNPGRARTDAAAVRKRCAEDQQQLARTFDISRVPESLRALAPWARRYGVGDDHCRPLLLRRLSKKQRTALTHEIDEHAQAIQAWLDDFGGGSMPPEAAAFMYLALGVDEIREQS